MSRSFLKTEVAIGSYAIAVHDDGNAALMAFRIDVVESHDIHSTRLEIAAVSEMEGLGRDPKGCEEKRSG